MQPKGTPGAYQGGLLLGAKMTPGLTGSPGCEDHAVYEFYYLWLHNKGGPTKAKEALAPEMTRLISTGLDRGSFRALGLLLGRSDEAHEGFKRALLGCFNRKGECPADLLASVIFLQKCRSYMKDGTFKTWLNYWLETMLRKLAASVVMERELSQPGFKDQYGAYSAWVIKKN